MCFLCSHSFRNHTFSAQPIKAQRIGSNNDASNITHLLYGLRTSINALERRFEELNQTILHLKEEITLIKVHPLSSISEYDSSNMIEVFGFSANDEEELQKLLDGVTVIAF